MRHRPQCRQGTAAAFGKTAGHRALKLAACHDLSFRGPEKPTFCNVETYLDRFHFVSPDSRESWAFCKSTQRHASAGGGARDLPRAWYSAGASVETRKKILRLLIEEIVANVADEVELPLVPVGILNPIRASLGIP
jgi:hypothetical protein